MPKTAETTATNTKRRVPGRPFTASDARSNRGGRPVLTPEERAQRAEARRVAREVALGNMKLDIICREHAPLAVRALVEITKSCPEPGERRLAAAELLNRGFGKPTETQLIAAAVGVNSTASNQLAEAMTVLREVFALPQRVITHDVESA